MCGIAGFSRSQDSTTEYDANELLAELALSIEPRGKDATGAAWRDIEGELWVQKAAINATAFVKQIAADSTALSGIVHTRYATKGDPDTNANNHPIERAELSTIVGIHNGQVRNDDELFALTRRERTAEVDSEAIFALIETAVAEGMEVGEALSLVRGTMALAWFSGEDERNVLWLARGSGSPLVVAQTKCKTLLFASTEGAVRNGAALLGTRISWLQNVPEGVLLRVRDGIITDESSFTVHSAGIRPMTNYSVPSSAAPKKRQHSRQRSGHSTFDFDRRYTA